MLTQFQPRPCYVHHRVGPGSCLVSTEPAGVSLELDVLQVLPCAHEIVGIGHGRIHHSVCLLASIYTLQVVCSKVPAFLKGEPSRLSPLLSQP